MDTNKQKDLLRSKYRIIREKAAPIAEEAIFKQVELLIEELISLKSQEGFICIYWPLPGEIDLRRLKTKYSSRLALPVCNQNKQLSYHPWLEEPLGIDACSIKAPTRERMLSPKEISLLLVPALSIDIHGQRLGYGGGYFDRLRIDPEWKAITALAVLPKACISKEDLPIDSWDINFNGWVNEAGVYK